MRALLVILLLTSPCLSWIGCIASGADFRALSHKESTQLAAKIVDSLQNEYLDVSAQALATKNGTRLKAQLVEVIERKQPDLESWAQAINKVLFDAIGDPTLVIKKVWAENRLQAHIRHARESNFGIGTVEVTDGIGYIQITEFTWPRGSDALLKKRLFEVFSKVNNARSLIFDVRKNGGGSSEMAATISSFIIPEGTITNELHFRDPSGRKFEELKSQPPSYDASLAALIRSNNGTTMLSFRTVDVYENFGLRSNLKDVPVVVLTDSETFGAAEGFAYHLKHLNRASIVGARTKGGAHPYTMIPLGFGMEMMLPTGASRNPITRSNWHKSGIEPDIRVPASQAMAAATEYLRDGGQ